MGLVPCRKRPESWLVLTTMWRHRRWPSRKPGLRLSAAAGSAPLDPELCSSRTMRDKWVLSHSVCDNLLYQAQLIQKKKYIYIYFPKELSKLFHVTLCLSTCLFIHPSIPLSIAPSIHLPFFHSFSRHGLRPKANKHNFFLFTIFTYDRLTLISSQVVGNQNSIMNEGC